MNVSAGLKANEAAYLDFTMLHSLSCLAKAMQLHASPHMDHLVEASPALFMKDMMAFHCSPMDAPAVHPLLYLAALTCPAWRSCRLVPFHCSPSVGLQRHALSCAMLRSSHLVQGSHALHGSLVGQVQGAPDDIDLLVSELPPQALSGAMQVHQSLQLSAPEQGLQVKQRCQQSCQCCRLCSHSRAWCCCPFLQPAMGCRVSMVSSTFMICHARSCPRFLTSGT